MHCRLLSAYTDLSFSEMHGTYAFWVDYCIPVWTHAAANLWSACLRHCSIDASSVKSYAKTHSLVFHFPTVTHSSIRLWLPIQFADAMKRRDGSMHSCWRATPVGNGCNFFHIQTSDEGHNDLMSSWWSPPNRAPATLPTAFLRIHL